MLFLIDLDGTLIDSEPFHYQTWGKILNESPSYIENIVNTIGMNDFLENYKDRDVLRKHKLNEMLKVKGIKLIKNADKFINFITNHNINHVVVTNSNRELVEHFKREVPELNKLKNWITREDYNKPKPDSECYELAVKLYGEHENKIIGFENSIHGIKALSHITENIFYICEKTDYLKILKHIKHIMPKKVWYAPNKFESYGEEEIKAVEACLRDGWLAGFGDRSVEFEKRVADLFGKKYGLFVNSGSSAILLGLCALNLPKGSEVVTPACGFATTVAPIVQLGLKPVFCDVGLNTYVPSVDDLKKVVTPETKCLLLPNLIGNMPDWSAIREAFPNVILFEDSADTITHTPCTDVSTTSFYASHVITAGGVGGMVMFNDEEHLKRSVMFRDWGRIGDNIEEPSERFNHSVDGIPYDWKFLYGVAGYHLKACEMNAAFGLAQLDKLEGFLRKRRENVERYIENLKDCPYYTLPDDSQIPNWLAIPLQCPDRLEIVNFLEENDVQTRVTFAGNITRHPAFREYLGEFENADKIMKDGFLLGAHHGLDTEDVDRVCNLLKTFAATKVNA